MRTTDEITADIQVAMSRTNQFDKEDYQSILDGVERLHELQREVDALRADKAASVGLSRLEWRAIYDALAFTARNSGCVSNAHNRVVDHACKVLGLSAEPNP